MKPIKLVSDLLWVLAILIGASYFYINDNVVFIGALMLLNVAVLLKVMQIVTTKVGEQTDQLYRKINDNYGDLMKLAGKQKPVEKKPINKNNTLTWNEFSKEQMKKGLTLKEASKLWKEKGLNQN